jgi:hypothetical protein
MMIDFVANGSNLANGVAKVFDNFLFKPASARPLAVFRIGLALVLIWQAFLLHNNLFDFFGHSGFVQREVSLALNDPTAPNFNALIDTLSAFGLNEGASLIGISVLYVLSLFFLLVGFFTRGTALLVWFLHWSFLNTGYSGVYGVDLYAHIFLFYLIFAPSHRAYSLDLMLKRVSGDPSSFARLSLRVLQLHMCISYLASGLEKASGAQWWNGEILWRSLIMPGYSVADFYWLAYVPFLPMVMGWAVLALEIFYCVMVWPKRSRQYWIMATCLMHLGIAIFLKLHVFGILMCIPNFALFCVNAEEHSDVDSKATHSKKSP